MSMTPSEWNAIQERAVNPFRAVESNAVNRLTRILTLGKDVILTDHNIAQEDFKTMTVLQNSYVKDDVYIQFDENVNIDFTDEGNYLSLTDRGMNRPGTYYLVLHYVYNESIPFPVATFKILKNPQELTAQSLLLAECKVIYSSVNSRFEIESFNTENCNYVRIESIHANITAEFTSLLNICASQELRHQSLLKRVEELERKMNIIEGE